MESATQQELSVGSTETDPGATNAPLADRHSSSPTEDRCTTWLSPGLSPESATQQEPSVGFTETEYGLENAEGTDRHASTTVSALAGETAARSNAGTATSHTQAFISDLLSPERPRKSGCLIDRVIPTQTTRKAPNLFISIPSSRSQGAYKTRRDAVWFSVLRKKRPADRLLSPPRPGR
jgi:hypothetical protein